MWYRVEPAVRQCLDVRKKTTVGECFRVTWHTSAEGLAVFVTPFKMKGTTFEFGGKEGRS